MVYLDKTWANTQDGKDKACLENVAVTVVTVGDIHGKGNSMKLISESLIL